MPRKKTDSKEIDEVQREIDAAKHQPKKIVGEALATLEIPVRILHAVGVAGENTRYLMDGVMIESDAANGVVAAIATDGRCMIICHWNQQLYDSEMKLFISGDAVRSAIKLAPKKIGDDLEPMATIERNEDNDECALTVKTFDGEARLTFHEIAMPFPDYKSVVPDFQASIGTSLIGISADLVANVLKTLQKIVGEGPTVRVYLPSDTKSPLGFEAEDGDGLRVLAIVMPAKVDDWTEKPQAIKADKKKDDDAELPLGKTSKADAKKSSIPEPRKFRAEEVNIRKDELHQWMVGSDPDRGYFAENTVALFETEDLEFVCIDQSLTAALFVRVMPPDWVVSDGDVKGLYTGIKIYFPSTDETRIIGLPEDSVLVTF